MITIAITIGSGGGSYNPGWNGAGGGGRSAVRLNGTTSDLVTAGGGILLLV